MTTLTFSYAVGWRPRTASVPGPPPPRREADSSTVFHGGTPDASCIARWRASRSSNDHAERPDQPPPRFLLEAEVTGGLEHPGNRPGLRPAEDTGDGRPLLRHAVYPAATRPPRKPIEHHSTPTRRCRPTHGRRSLAAAQAAPAVHRRLQCRRLRGPLSRRAPSMTSAPGNVLSGQATARTLDHGLGSGPAPRPPRNQQSTMLALGRADASAQLRPAAMRDPLPGNASWERRPT